METWYQQHPFLGPLAMIECEGEEAADARLGYSLYNDEEATCIVDILSCFKVISPRG